VAGGDGLRLGSQSPEDNTLWGLNRVDIPGPVAPDTEAIFRFSLTAPSEQGIYPLQWRMVDEGVEWFGDPTPSVAVVVARPEHPECVGLAETIQQARDEIAAASAEMEAADPADKPAIAAAITSWTTTLNDAERRALELGCPPV
jgi:hypothetical protein